MTADIPLQELFHHRNSLSRPQAAIKVFWCSRHESQKEGGAHVRSATGMAIGMVTVWLWDAEGPGRSASGVTADDGKAKNAAEEGMITTGAATATVEQATHLAGGGWIRSGYHRTGTGWTASRTGSRIRWTKFRRPERVAS
jgi:hypothetical protein